MIVAPVTGVAAGLTDEPVQDAGPAPVADSTAPGEIPGLDDVAEQVAGQQPAEVGRTLAGVGQAVDTADALAAELAPRPGLAESLDVVASTSPDAAQPHAAPADLDAAVHQLYAVAGVEAPDAVTSVSPEMDAALTPLVAATASAAQLAEQATGTLSDEEMAFLAENVHLLTAPAPDEAGTEEHAEEVAALAAEVDVPKLAQGARILADAIDELPSPDQLEGQGTPSTTCVDPNCWIAVGSPSADVHDHRSTEHVLLLEPGGDDVHRGPAGAYAPGSGQPVPVSVVADLDGHDRYQLDRLHPSSTTSAWGQGVGIAGIGLLADAQGSDTYDASLSNEQRGCNRPAGAPGWWTVNHQTVYAQGVGVFGVGALADSVGDDDYAAESRNHVRSFCHLGFAYTFAQGTGVYGGVGLLADAAGVDERAADASAKGEGFQDNIAHLYAQGAGAGGVGLMIDGEGADTNACSSRAWVGLFVQKGTMAYAFCQGTSTATRRAAPAMVGWEDGRSLCHQVLGDSFKSHGGPGNGCNTGSIGLAVDLGGADVYESGADVQQLDPSRPCIFGSWAVTSSQGSAAWSGLGLLVDTGDEAATDAGASGDRFHLTTEAGGNICRVRNLMALNYGQGFGGAIIWDRFDRPYLTGENAAIGALVNTGPACPTAAPGASCPVATGDDVYQSNAEAINRRSCGGCGTFAESWVQGSADRTADDRRRNTYHSLGAGLHVDLGGDDVLESTALANRGQPTERVVSQGATNGGVAALANLGGQDTYRAEERSGGNPHAQLYADEGLTVATPNLCPKETGCIGRTPVTTLPAVAVFVDVMGQDTYSQTQGAPCPANGQTAPHLWGMGTPGACDQPGIALGVDWLS